MKLTPAASQRHRSSLLILIFCLGVLGAAVDGPRVHAQTSAPAKFSLSVGGAMLRQQPWLSSPLTEPIFQPTAYDVVARSADRSWLKLTLEPSNDTGWVLASLGSVQGDVASVMVEQPKRATLPPAKATSSPYVSPITPKMKKLWAQSVKAGRRADLFTVIGDCNSEPSAYLWRLSAGSFDVSQRPELQRVVEQFSWSFTRGSVAAFSGFNSASMFDPQWANPQLCEKTDGPLACEMRVSRASIAFVALGTGDQFTWKDFEANYRHIVDFLLQNNVLPVLVTKADDLENQQGGAASGYINDIIRRLGAEYGMPVMDFYAATRKLPDFGMRWEGNENFHMSAAGSDTRLLLTLQTLAALTAK